MIINNEYYREMSVTTNTGAKKWAAFLTDVQRKAFWIVGLLVLFFIAYFYYSGLNRPVAGTLWFVAGFVVLYYYWVRWFVLKKQPDPDFNPSRLACPDYLSAVPPGELYQATSPTQYFCVDFVGVSRNGGLHRTHPATLKSDIRKPTHRFSVDPVVDFGSRDAMAAFMQRLQSVGLSYNQLGESSLPTHNDGVPTSSAAGGFILTPAAMKEMGDYGKAHPIVGQPTDAQLQAAANHLVSKGMAPPGTTGAQLMSAMMGGAPLNLTPVQLATINTVLQEYNDKNPLPSMQPGGDMGEMMMANATRGINDVLIPRGLVPPGTTAMQLLSEMMKQAQKDQQNAGIPPEFMIRT